MKIIGLCGGSGSGKGTVAAMFSEFGFIHIDTDAVYHDITSSKSECLTDLCYEFGNGILNEVGALDRKKLAKIVFESEDAEKKRLKLNEIAHYHVLKATRELIKSYELKGAPVVLVDAPLLFESGFDKECEIIICVTADKDIRKSRIMLRDSISELAALQRIDSQCSDGYLIEHSDYNIVNNGTTELLFEKVRDVAEKILNT